MPHTLAELSQLVGGTLQGDAQRLINRAMPLGMAVAGDITLLDDSERSGKAAASCTASALVVGLDSPNRQAIPAGIAVIEVPDIHAAFTKLVRTFRPPRIRTFVGVSPQAHVSPQARLAENVDIHAGATICHDVEIGSGTVIHPGVYVGPGCRIGRDVTIFPNSVLYENVSIGDRTLIHAAVIIGAYGFGYRLQDGRHVLTQQLGYVEIGSDVEVGAGTTIDRGTYGPTVIGEGTKIDDQVMIGHNCRIGRHNLICAQVGMAGSSSTGDYVVLAGQVGVRDHIQIGDRAMVGAKAGIMYDVAPETSMVGIPAYPMKEWRMQQVVIQKLPDLRHQVKELE
ncbi:MAG: UDP-3-O-(3-hydroxymyristoyl)glucosamine N-acyltransferase, partial [Planctomycetaceae bacterium]|nr:UDP-3-O-(3-hydroxymyristoyl)glucosamine N-acyltransferase [Planctomycetaceae bacterium]